MAELATNLNPSTNYGTRKTWTLDSHTIQASRVVDQKKVTPTGNQTVFEDSLAVIYSGVDSDGDVLPQKIYFGSLVKRPKGLASDTEIDAALADFRALVASDNFERMVKKQFFIDTPAPA
jgi:hypothetical protein